MSYHLFVDYQEVPGSLSIRWATAFAGEGFDLELYPGFEPWCWDGGFLPIRVLDAPRDWLGYSLPGEAISGFEVNLDDTSAWLHLEGTRSPLEFALLYVGASTLARITQGRVQDPQSGRQVEFAEAMDLAREEVRKFLGWVHPSDCAHRPFPGWKALSRRA